MRGLDRDIVAFSFGSVISLQHFNILNNSVALRMNDEARTVKAAKSAPNGQEKR